ncbi:MAG TPA: PqqD family protein [Methanophagales archaeon]|nr:PqqD family protein [Methanophagales archaeon]
MAEVINKKGELAKNQDGTVVLVNEKEQAFQADEPIIAIWQMCDGTRTKEDISTIVIEQTSMTTEDAEKLVSDIIGKLKEVELVT